MFIGTPTELYLLVGTGGFFCLIYNIHRFYEISFRKAVYYAETHFVETLAMKAFYI
jgi:hypothetical protein